MTQQGKQREVDEGKLPEKYAYWMSERCKFGLGEWLNAFTETFYNAV